MLLAHPPFPSPQSDSWARVEAEGSLGGSDGPPGLRSASPSPPPGLQSASASDSPPPMPRSASISPVPPQPLSPQPASDALLRAERNQLQGLVLVRVRVGGSAACGGVAFSSTRQVAQRHPAPAPLPSTLYTCRS